MSRQGWKSISITQELYDELDQHVPERARSVPEYLAHWARIGSLVDTARKNGKGLDELFARLFDELEKGKGGK